MPAAPGGFALVFAGECLEGHDAAVVRSRVAAALRLDEARTAKLFSGRPVVLRRGLDAATAFRRAARFAEMGARLRIEPPPGESIASVADTVQAVPAIVPMSPGAAGEEATIAAPAPAPVEAPAPVGAPAATVREAKRAFRWPRGPRLPTLPRRATTAALGVATVVVGGFAGVAWAPHLSAWLWSAAPAPATAPSSALPATLPAAPTAVATTAASTPAPSAPLAGATAAAPLPAAASPTVAPPDAATAPTAPPPPQSAAMPGYVHTMSAAARFEYGGPYSAAPPARAFAISDDGAHGWTAAAPSENQARAGALERCIRTGPARSGCRVVDVNGVAQE